MTTIRPVSDLCYSLLTAGVQHDGVVEFGCEPRMGLDGVRIAMGQPNPRLPFLDKARAPLRRPARDALRSDAREIAYAWTNRLSAVLGVEVDYIHAVVPPAPQHSVDVGPLGPVLRDLICTRVPPDVLGRGQAAITLRITLSKRGCTVRPHLAAGAGATDGPARIKGALGRAVKDWLEASRPLIDGRIKLVLRHGFETPTGHERMAIAARLVAMTRGQRIPAPHGG